MKKGKDGRDRVKIVYPKFKNGEAIVRNVHIPPCFGECFKVEYKFCYLSFSHHLVFNNFYHCFALTFEYINNCYL